MVRQPRAQHAEFAGTGDVDEVGLKALQHLADEGNVAEKCGIVAEIFSRAKERKPRGSSRVQRLPSSRGPGCGRRRGRRGREIAAAREGLKVAAGVGYAVHLVERVGEVGNARHVASLAAVSGSR